MILSHQHLLTLNGIKGFGPKKIHAIAKYLRDVESASLSNLEMCDIIRDMIGHKVIKGVIDFNPSAFMIAADRANRILKITERNKISMVSRYEESYPKALLYTNNEDGKEAIPSFLFYKGDISAINHKSIAIIGTRNPSPEGEMASFFFAKTIAENGINIVSGLALGCDTFAHRGALEGNGVTTAILGGGLDMIYPSENAELAERIVDGGGLLLTEHPVGDVTTPYSLVARDRLQSALSQVILVIQTGVNGGTMHTVGSAHVANKPIFAVEFKKDLLDVHIAGNRLLIRKGTAKPLSTSKDDISILLNCIKTTRMIPNEASQLSLF